MQVRVSVPRCAFSTPALIFAIANYAPAISPVRFDDFSQDLTAVAKAASGLADRPLNGRVASDKKSLSQEIIFKILDNLQDRSRRRPVAHKPHIKFEPRHHL
jgi:hypothetical protein